jgi:hypothetical protein
MKEFLIKMFLSIVIGGFLSYFAIRVTSLYLTKSGVFNLAHPAEFISVFSTMIFFCLATYKGVNDLFEEDEEKFRSHKIEYIPYEEVK